MSFMVRPSFLDLQQIGHAYLRAAQVRRRQVWHLSVRMAQKVCGPNRKTVAAAGPRSLASPAGSHNSPKMQFYRQRRAGPPARHLT
jgi:hypothetical protein